MNAALVLAVVPAVVLAVVLAVELLQLVKPLYWENGLKRVLLALVVVVSTAWAVIRHANPLSCWTMTTLTTIANVTVTALLSFFTL